MNSLSIKCLALVLAACCTLAGCRKLVEVAPPATSANGANVYTSDATAAAVLTGLYTKMSADGLVNGNFFNSFMSFYGELSADNLKLYSGVNNTFYTAFYTNNVLNNTTPNCWTGAYPTIFIINSAIEGLSGSSSLTPAIRQQLLGESYFLRAYEYFYLTNLYGDVPLVTTTDPMVNSIIKRSPQQMVFQQIVSDLKNAQGLLTSGYVYSDGQTTTAERTRPNKWAATALLSRTYLYLKYFDSAATQSTAVINNSSQYNLKTLDSVFLANSKEAIWQLQPVNTGRNTEDAWLFITPSTGPSVAYPVSLSPALLSSFETGDNRSTHWVSSVTAASVKYYFPYKYKSAKLNNPVTEYEMILRLGEQYLIRAEAETAQNDLTDAVKDLNTIRARAGLPGTTASTQSDIQSAIQRERRVELFAEMGHRWLDLKRTGTVDAVMAAGGACAAKGGTWNSYAQLFPIPLTELKLNPNLVQNPGY